MPGRTCFFVASDAMLLRRMRLDPQGLLATIRDYDGRASLYYQECRELRVALARAGARPAEFRRLRQEIAFLRRIVAMLAAGRVKLARSTAAAGG
jgi:hypothetical protein